MQKIDILKTATNNLINQVHIPQLHYGAITTFNSKVTTGNLTNHIPSLTAQVSKMNGRGGTALYDSIIHSIISLIRNGRRGVPKLLLTFTDGDDTSSKSNIDEIHRLIIDSGFYPKNGCYMGIVGVGKATVKTLNHITLNGQLGKVLFADSPENIHRFFIDIVSCFMRLYGLHQQIQVSRNAFTHKTLAFYQQVGAISAMDYCLNLDDSYSMNPNWFDRWFGGM